MNERIDAADRRILALLQDNSAATIQRIAAMIGLSASTVHERIRKLEARGPDAAVEAPPATAAPTRESASDRAAPVILGYEARIDPAALNLGLLAFVFVRADERVGAGDAGHYLAAIPEVQEVHHVAGEDCYLVKLRTQDTASLGRLLRERFAAIPNIRSTRTTIVLDTIKETARLPIAAEPPADADATAPPLCGVDPIEMTAAPHARPTARSGARRTTRTATPRHTRAAQAQRRESERSE
ncbi:MAG TPA: Lrp/AsnC family transcriptional regulator [Ktedonobacterales bacterium]|jgi:Lrp/AsnC family leucine-responsive transcriptional regulator